jgi:hypothetical protein
VTADNKGFAIDYFLNEREQCDYATGGVRWNLSDAGASSAVICRGHTCTVMCTLMSTSLAILQDVGVCPDNSQLNSTTANNVRMLSYSNAGGVVGHNCHALSHCGCT